jgi:hypothetical protein
MGDWFQMLTVTVANKGNFSLLMVYVYVPEGKQIIYLGVDYLVYLIT